MLACGIFCNYKAVLSELSSFFINNSLNQWRILKSSSSLCSCTSRSCSSCSCWLIPHHVSFIWVNLRVEFWEHRLQPPNSMCKYKAHFLFYFFSGQPRILVFFFPEGGSERKKITPFEDLRILLQNRQTSTVFYPFPLVPMSADNENYSSYKVLIKLQKVAFPSSLAYSSIIPAYK